MADEPSAWDKFTGVVKSALQGPIGQNIVGGALGAMTQGDPYTIDRFWTGIEQQKQRKALHDLAVNAGVIKPEEPLPASLTDPAQLLPQWKYTKEGYWEESFGKPPRFVSSGAPPPQKPVVRMTEQGLMMVTPDASGRPSVTPVLGPGGEKLTSPYKPVTEKPLRRIMPDGSIIVFHPDGTQEFVPPPSGFTGGKPPTARELRARKILQDAGIQNPNQDQFTNALIQVDAEDAKKKDVPKDLQKSLEGLRAGGVTFRDPITGAQVRSEGKVKTGADAVAQGAVMFNKQDETLFTNREGTAEMAKQMQAILPKLTERDLDTMKKRVKEQPYWSAALGQMVQNWEFEIQSNDSPALKQYLALMKKIQVEKIRELFPTGRLPVYDQQLFMGKDISPRDTLEVQKSQLELLRTTAIQQMKKMLSPTTVSPLGEVPEAPTAPEIQPGEIREGRDGIMYRFRGGDISDRANWEVQNAQ